MMQVEREKMRIRREYSNAYRRSQLNLSSPAPPPNPDIFFTPHQNSLPSNLSSSSPVQKVGDRTRINFPYKYVATKNLGKPNRLWIVWRLWCDEVSKWSVSFFQSGKCSQDYGKYVQDFLNRKVRRWSGMEKLDMREFMVFKVLEHQENEMGDQFPHRSPFNLRVKNLNIHDSSKIWTLNSGGDLAEYLKATFCVGEIIIISIKRTPFVSWRERCIPLNFVPVNCSIFGDEEDDDEEDFPPMDIIRIPPPTKSERNETNIVEHVMPREAGVNQHRVNYFIWENDQVLQFTRNGRIFKIKMDLFTFNQEELTIALPITDLETAEDLYSHALMSFHTTKVNNIIRRVQMNAKRESIFFAWSKVAKRTTYTLFVIAAVSFAWYFSFCDLCFTRDPWVVKLEEASENSTFTVP